MGAALAGIGKQALTAVVSGGVASRVGGVDTATAVVRIGRFAYVCTLTYTLGIWYFGWRNERVEDGTGLFPIPGIYKGGKIRDGAPDADDASPVFGSATDAAAGTGATNTPAQDNVHGGTGNQQLAPGVGGNKSLLVRLGNTAQTAFGLHVSENSAFGGVHPVHVPNSYHYKDRAIDCAANPVNAATLGHAAAFAHWVVNNYLSHLTELIWNGPNPVFVSGGKVVSASVYVDSLASHKTHVHIAI